MGRNLENRVNKIVERVGAIDPAEAMNARIEAQVAAMSDEEKEAKMREILLADGYDPSLPYDEAMDLLIQKVEAKAGEEPEDQEWTRRFVALLKDSAGTIARLFPRDEAAEDSAA